MKNKKLGKIFESILGIVIISFFMGWITNFRGLFFEGLMIGLIVSWIILFEIYSKKKMLVISMAICTIAIFVDIPLMRYTFKKSLAINTIVWVYALLCYLYLNKNMIKIMKKCHKK